MLDRLFRPLMPRGLIGRAALILIVPVTGILVLTSAGVIQRHYDRVTRQLTQEFARTVAHVSDHAGAPSATPGSVADLGEVFGIEARLAPPPALGPEPPLPLWELSLRLVRRELGEAFPQALALRVVPGSVTLVLPLPGAGAAGGDSLTLHFSPSRLSATNPHQLLVIAILAAILMGLIGFVFLRNQLRPIRRLARAAEAFGRGERVDLRIAGATEVRAAAQAFLDMRDRIEAQIEQRALMLSGVSHDLRTPLTRARLALSLMDDQPEAAEVLADLAQMEALIERYLDFVRDGAQEPEADVDLAALVAERVAAAVRGGGAVRMRPAPALPGLRLRPALLARALDNLIGNALRYGDRAEVWIEPAPGGLAICVEDNGPGIPAERRSEALRPFARLDPSRRADGGVGLGLAIAADAMRAHGGRVELDAGQGPGLGGLLARLVLPEAGPDQRSSSIHTGV